ncbi:MAG: hypothetical protein NTV43_07905 [Methylococcales bacterium]|nr:hypothetical protein [Methylococcales bacterium]
MNKNIILVHGVLGFGGVRAISVSYYSGLANYLGQHGHEALAPSISPTGSLTLRAEQLAKAIDKHYATGDVHIIAHGLGGLDARYLLRHYPDLARRVKSLVTIGTPHRGSVLADAILNPADPLYPHIPPFLAQQMEANFGALYEMGTEAGCHFDDTTPDVEGVRYIEVAGDAAKGGNAQMLFKLSAAISKLSHEVNDGVVTRRSALCERPGHQHLDDWPIDHAGQVGWDLDSIRPFMSPPQLKRYLAIVDML